MRRLGAIGIVGVATLFLVSGLSAQELAAIHPELPGDPSVAFMRVYGSTEPPQAFLRFCDEFPEECASTSGIAARPPATAQRFRELDEINARVNHTIRPEEDLKQDGIADYWTLPADGRGDCEDYALLKRHELFKLGWPSSALLMTIVVDEKGKGHAVLTPGRQPEISSSTTRSTRSGSGPKRRTDFFCGNRTSTRGFGWISIRPETSRQCQLRVWAQPTES